ncbi:MAG: hypothetical protein IPG86_14130 [Chitinophagaceae bacterium]|nr:hypothetical protein [Chitinophagaceae bacterium]
MDQGKNIFDGYIQSMAVTDRFMWLGAQDRLIKWDRQTDQSEFIPLILPNGRNISGRETIRRVFPLNDGRLIIGSSTQGLLFFNPVTGHMKQLSRKSETADTLLPSNQINAIAIDQQKKIWVGTPRELYGQTHKHMRYKDSVNIPYCLPSVKSPVWCYGLTGKTGCGSGQ